MPDRSQLKVGDRIRLLRVPQGNLAQRERELRNGTQDAGWTADTIESILRLDPVVTISFINAHHPSYEYTFAEPIGGCYEHALAIVEDDSWELA